LNLDFLKSRFIYLEELFSYMKWIFILVLLLVLVSGCSLLGIDIGSDDTVGTVRGKVEPVAGADETVASIRGEFEPETGNTVATVRDVE